MSISSLAEQIEADPALRRYSRQILVDGIGVEGQKILMRSRIVLFGCGALGSAVANTLVRAGVGHIRLIDRDFIERNNLQRQLLFDEQDIADNLPKAEAARRKLAVINSDVDVEAVVTDINHTNIEQLADAADVLLDGLDNFETRFLVNDLAVKTNRPWVYGGVIGATGLTMPIIPGVTPCLRCVFESAPPAGMNPTCDTAGVLAAVVNLVAAMQAMDVMKILLGKCDPESVRLLSIDLWKARFNPLNVAKAKQRDCPCCTHRQFEYLDGKFGSDTTTLCGRNAVQISPRQNGQRLEFDVIAKKLNGVAKVRFNKFMLKAQLGDHNFTLFADGRAIIQGTNKPEVARSIYAKYVGA